MVVSVKILSRKRIKTIDTFIVNVYIKCKVPVGLFSGWRRPVRITLSE